MESSAVVADRVVAAVPGLPRRFLAVLCSALTCCAWSSGCGAWTTTIPRGSQYAYLGVGNATTLANDSTLNTVAVTVPAGALGNGVAQVMSSDSTQVNSVYDGYGPICTTPNEVYIAATQRQPRNTGSSAVLSVTTTGSLINTTGNAIPFSSISWTISNLYLGSTTLPAGSFAGGTQTIASIPINSFVEDCMTFAYANASVPRSGTYSGLATYTLVLP